MATRDSRTQKEPLKPKRRYFGQDEAEALLNWLNLTDDKVGRKRIIRLVHTYREAQREAGQIGPEELVMKRGRWWAIETEAEKRLEALVDEVNGMLSFYQTVPEILVRRHSKDMPAPAGKPNAVFELMYVPAPGSDLERHIEKSRLIPRGKKWKTESGKREFSLPGRQTAESGAARLVISLIQSGVIWKLIPCRCGKFFFKKFPHQMFCSNECKLAEARENPEKRAQRNAYARELYNLHKSGKVK
jgi:hypothetical protein